jgi:hypothetical protein
MIEELLQTFVRVINAQLFESVELERIRTISFPVNLTEKSTDLENFEASNVKDGNEILSFGFDIECDVDTLDEPAEHAEVDLKNERSMLFSSTVLACSSC